jgi:hypothetical protein
VLDAGSLEFRGTVVEGLGCYSQIVMKRDEAQTDLKNTGWRQLTVNGEHGASFPRIAAGAPFSVEGILDLKENYLRGALIFIIEDSAGNTVVHRYIESNEIQPGNLASGRYEVHVELPPLWLAPGIYSSYFKFLGHRQALSQSSNTFSSGEDRPRSERIMLDVVGDARGISRASLAPNVQWGLTPVRIGERPSEELSVRAEVVSGRPTE